MLWKPDTSRARTCKNRFVLAKADTRTLFTGTRLCSLQISEMKVCSRKRPQAEQRYGHEPAEMEAEGERHGGTSADGVEGKRHSTNRLELSEKTRTELNGHAEGEK